MMDRENKGSNKNTGIITEGPTLFTTPYQVMGLNIMDFNRPNGVWSNPGDALETISSWLIHRARFTKIEVMDFEDAPVRDDCPDWKHYGKTHGPIGENLRNWFYWKFPHSKLALADEPDFYGWFAVDDGFDHKPKFWGDIGKVSISTFSRTIKGMSNGDLWISVLDEGRRQVIIELLVDNCTDCINQIFRHRGPLGDIHLCSSSGSGRINKADENGMHCT